MTLRVRPRVKMFSGCYHSAINERNISLFRRYVEDRTIKNHRESNAGIELSIIIL